MKKLCLLCNGYGLVARGAERLTEDIYKLLKKDYSIDLISVLVTKTKTRDKIKIPWRNGKAYLESYYFGKKWSSSSSKDYDLILNNAGFPGSYWCNRYRKKTKIPFVTWERGGGREERINNLFKPDKIVYLTKISMDKSRYKKKVHLPIGINTKEFSIKRPPLDYERPIFLSTSAMVYFKHIELIIDMVSEYGKGSFVQTSEGKEETQLKKHAEEFGIDYHFLGKVSRERLADLYYSSDFLCSASLNEAFGIVYLEAMASGLPIIAQDDARRREIIGDCGIFVDWRNPHHIASIIDDLDFDKSRIKKRAKEFDWKTLKPKYVELIESLT